MIGSGFQFLRDGRAWAAVAAAALLGALPRAGAAASEAGLPPVEHFGIRVYAQHNQTWAAVQDRAGVLYVGNKDVVLTYDGHRWGAVRTGGLFVRGLALDAEDRVWIGAVDEFGYLEDDGTGGRRYVSLRAHWREPAGTYVRQTLALAHGVYLVTETHVLRWHAGTLARVREGRARAFVVDGELVVHATGQPVVAFDGRRWREVVDAPLVRNDRVLMLEPLPDGAWLLGLQRGGFYRLAGGALTAWPTAVDAALRAGTIDRGWRLRDGTLVVTQRPGGMLLLAPDGSLRHALGAANGGLNADYVINVFQDRDGDLWVSQNSGISRLAWSAGFTVFGSSNGLGRGAVQAMHRHAGEFFVGTTDEIFVLEPAAAGGAAPRSAQFRRVPGSGSDVWRLASAGEELLAVGHGGLYAYRPGAAQAENVWVSPGPIATGLLVPRAAPDRALVAVDNRLLELQREGGRWRSRGAIGGVDGELRLLAEAADGAVWAAAASRGFYRIRGLAGTASADGGPVRVERFAGGNGFVSAALAGLPILAEQEGTVAFLDERKIFRFDAAAGRFRLILDADAVMGFPIAAMPTLGAGTDGHWWTRTLRDDAGAGPWRGRQFWRLGPEGARQRLPFAAADAIGENPYVFEEKGDSGTVAWLAGSEGLVRAELPAAVAGERAFRATIRRVETARGEARPAGGAGEEEFPFAAQALSVSFATDRLDERRMSFRTRLDDEEWSAWTATSTLALDRLPAGRHAVRVQARDADGRESVVAEFRHRVRPPWWETWWARLAGVGLLGLAVQGAVRWRGAQLERRNRELEALVAARTSELAAASAAAEAANQAKSAFLAHMSHELRTPLNAILGFAQILRRAPHVPDEHRRRLEVISRNGDHLLAMINEILDLAKIEAGRLTADPRAFSLRQLLTGLAQTAALRAADNGIAFQTELAGELPDAVTGDEAKLRQVLTNLLSNALKFTEQGTVTLAARGVRAGGGAVRVEFAVVDTGVGIGAEEQARLFEPFHQTASGRASGQGTGLGLAISRRLVALLGGELRCESAAGRGSRFTFALELPPAAGTVGEPARTVTGYAGVRRRVLVVDDEPVNRDVLRGLLEPLGFAIEECADGAGCLAAFARQAADAVLLDLRMPGTLDGYATVRALRQQPGGRAPAVIAVSASVLESDRRTAIEAGCDDFLPKPFGEERLFALLGRCLDLTWSYAEHPEQAGGAAVEPGSAGDAAGAGLTAPEAEEMLDLARQGNLRALRTRLAAIRAARPGDAAALQRLETLAAGFQLGRLREALRHAAEAGRTDG